MSDDILKRAAFAALEKELLQLPPEQELSVRYRLSEEFEKRMDEMICENRSRYFSIFGKGFHRRSFIYPAYILVTVISLWLYFTDRVDFATARLIWALASLAVAVIFNDKTDISSYDSEYTKGFERKFHPAFLDMEKRSHFWADAPEMDFTLPKIPPGFTLKEEFRTSNKHIANFTDAYGNTVHYVRNSLKEIIDYVDADTVDIINITIRGYAAVEYCQNGENHIIWEDKFFQYHFHGKVGTDLLRIFAEG